MNKQKILKRFAFFLVILACISVAGAANESYNYVWNQSCIGGSCWIPWIATSEGRPKVDLNLYNVSAGNAQFSGNITVRGNVNITGKYYGDGSELSGVSTGVGNDSYNYVINESSNAWVGMRGNSKGVLKIDLTDTSINRLGTNARGTNLNLSGYLNVLGNLNVSGTSYLGSIIISADNITTNSILSKSGNVTFYNNAGSAIAIMTSDGKVGIGTMNPGQKLEILGNINSTGTVYANNFSSNSPLQLQTGGVTRIYVDSSNGNVGIGTGSPASYDAGGRNLVIATSGLAGMTIAGGSSSESAIYFADGTTGLQAYMGYLKYKHSDDSFILGVNAADKITILSDGKVGIGTVSPSEKLTVEESTNGAVSMLVNNPNTGTSARSQYILSATGNTASIRADLQALPTGFTSSPDLAGYIRLLTSGSGNGLIIQSKLTSGGIQFWVGDTDTRSSGEKMRIDSSGRVGIGTASPTAKLEVKDNAGGGIVAIFNNTASGNGVQILFEGGNAGKVWSIGAKCGSAGGCIPSDSFIISEGGVEHVKIFNTTGEVTITNLTGTGNAYVCANTNGKLYRSATACA
jgi:hypothetical protein